MQKILLTYVMQTRDAYHKALISKDKKETQTKCYVQFVNVKELLQLLDLFLTFKPPFKHSYLITDNPGLEGAIAVLVSSH